MQNEALVALALIAALELGKYLADTYFFILDERKHRSGIEIK